VARTQVGIIGAGPAGLLLSYLLHAEGIDAVVLEARSRDYVEKRVRAGVCEHPTVELLREIGVGARLDAEGLPHHGFSLRFDGQDHRIALSELTGKTITVYGQQEIVKDLIAAHEAKGYQVEFEVSTVELPELDRITYRDADGVARELDCDIIAGCDGFHGVSRPAIPTGEVKVFNREYPFAWLGVLARTQPSHEELIYTHHERGFALHSMRSPEVTRLYLQVPQDEKIEDWSDDRIWSELALRLETSAEHFVLREGPILDKGITPMRSFVTEPMQYGKLFLAGDVAHIVPPREGDEPGRRGRPPAFPCPGRAVAAQANRAGPVVLGQLPPAGVAGRALLLVHDLDAARRPRGRRLPAAPATLATALHRVLPCCRHQPRRELRRPALRVSETNRQLEVDEIRVVNLSLTHGDASSTR
jgi:p-hydroxybenzoate 3-monooxygenase